MFLALLHGETIVFGILLIGGLFWLSTFALFVWKRRYVAKHKVQFSIGYLILVAIFSLLSPSHDFDFIALFGVAITLPWSFFLPSVLGITAKLTASLLCAG